MSTFAVTASTVIDRTAAEVRAQFGDVAHHERTAVHDGVRFEVLHDDGRLCRYRQVSRIGPLRMRQELELDRGDDATYPLVNRITSGQFAGGTISFTISDAGPEGATVEAQVEAPLAVLARPLAPLLRRSVQRSLASALAEDKADLESGRYRNLADSAR